jgi:hypothetical protein
MSEILTNGLISCSHWGMFPVGLMMPGYSMVIDLAGSWEIDDCRFLRQGTYIIAKS